MRQKSWAAADLVAPPAETIGPADTSDRNDRAFESLLQAATAVAGGEATGGTCGAGIGPCGAPADACGPGWHPPLISPSRR